MKSIFASLLCFVFLESQVFAIHGGPPTTNLFSATTTGTFAGVLLPQGTDPTQTDFVNALGLFTMTIPTTGIASGQFFYFAEGQTFEGTIQGLADPGTGVFRGVLAGNFTQQFNTTNNNNTGVIIVAISRVAAFANGQIAAQIGAEPNIGGTRLTGSASVTIEQSLKDVDGNPTGQPDPSTASNISLLVDGFLQG